MRHKQEIGEFSCPLLAQTEKADQLAENWFFLGKLPVASRDPMFLVIIWEAECDPDREGRNFGFPDALLQSSKGLVQQDEDP